MIIMSLGCNCISFVIFHIFREITILQTVSSLQRNDGNSKEHWGWMFWEQIIRMSQMQINYIFGMSWFVFRCHVILETWRADLTLYPQMYKQLLLIRRFYKGQFHSSFNSNKFVIHRVLVTSTSKNEWVWVNWKKPNFLHKHIRYLSYSCYSCWWFTYIHICIYHGWMEMKFMNSNFW